MPKPIVKEIFEAWDWHLEDALKRANSILRHMEKEFKQNNIREEDYAPYIKQKFHEIVQRVDG